MSTAAAARSALMWCTADIDGLSTIRCGHQPGIRLSQLGATLVLDRSGVTGDDGPSHNGLWDLAMFQAVPGLRIAAPCDLPTLREDVLTTDTPTRRAVPQGRGRTGHPPVRRLGKVDVLREAQGTGVLLIAVGTMARVALDAAQLCAEQGAQATVVDPLWVKPLPREVLRLAAGHVLVATIEDGLRLGGVGATLTQALHDAAIRVSVRTFGVTDGFPR